MSSVEDGTGNRFASTVEYSTSSDQVQDEDHRVDDFPHGRVAPAPEPDSGEKGKKKGKPERVDRPMDSRVVADARGTRMSEEGHPAVPEAEKKPTSPATYACLEPRSSPR